MAERDKSTSRVRLLTALGSPISDAMPGARDCLVAPLSDVHQSALLEEFEDRADLSFLGREPGPVDRNDAHVTRYPAEQEREATQVGVRLEGGQQGEGAGIVKGKGGGLHGQRQQDLVPRLPGLGDPVLQPLGVGIEGQGDRPRQASHGGLGGGAAQAQPADDDGDARTRAVVLEGPGVGLPGHAAVLADLGQGTLGTLFGQGPDRERRPGVAPARRRGWRRRPPG